MKSRNDYILNRLSLENLTEEVDFKRRTREASPGRGQSAEPLGLKHELSSGLCDSDLFNKFNEEVALESVNFNRIRLPFSSERSDGNFLRYILIDLPKMKEGALVRSLVGKGFYFGLTEAEFLTLDFLLQKLWKSLSDENLAKFAVLVLQMNGTASENYDQVKRFPETNLYKLVQKSLNMQMCLRPSLTPKITSFLQSLEVGSQKEIMTLFSKWKIPATKNFRAPLVFGNLSVKQLRVVPPKAYIGKGYTDQGTLMNPADCEPLIIMNGEESSTSYDEFVSQTLNSY